MEKETRAHNLNFVSFRVTSVSSYQNGGKLRSRVEIAP